jgi:hypothetical protein
VTLEGHIADGLALDAGGLGDLLEVFKGPGVLLASS